MTKPVTIPNTFATATTAIPLSQLDSDFSTVATALNDANTYSNNAADTGVANAYVVTLTGVSTTYSAGLRIQFKAGAANTGASTLNVNSGGTKNITFQDASALSSGTIAANAIVDVMYDGTQFLLMNDPAGTVGTGDVVGPAGATANAVVRFDSTTGKLVKNSVVTIADSTGDVAGVGALTATGNVSFDGGTFVFNESGADKDFRIEGDTEPNLFFTDASTDRVGIGTSSPAYKLDVIGSSRIQSSSGYNFFFQTSATTARINYQNDAFSANISAAYRATDFSWQKGDGSEILKLDSSGNLGLGVTPGTWGSNFKAIQVGDYAAFSHYLTAAAAIVSSNARNSNNTDWVYLYTGVAATRYETGLGAHRWYTAPSGTAGATTSITSGQVYTVTTLGSTTLGQWQAYFSGLSSIPSIGQSITATATGTLAGGATVTQTITFTQAMTLDASGQLGLGTTTPKTAGGGAYKWITTNGTSGGGFTSYVNGTEASNFYANTTGTFIQEARSAPIIFETAATERARITSGGDLLVGQTSTTTPGDGNTTVGSSLQGVGKLYVSGGTSRALALNRNDDGAVAGFFRSGTQVGSISVTTTATAYNTSSDYRLKDNPQPLTGSGAFIDALKPKTWNWKADGSRGVGFIAHEVQEVSPGSVVGEKDGEQMQTMEYGSAEFIANIIAELQSLRQRVAELEGK